MSVDSEADEHPDDCLCRACCPANEQCCGHEDPGDCDYDCPRFANGSLGF